MAATTASLAQNLSNQAEEIVNAMSIDQLIGQMTQLAIDTIMLQNSNVKTVDSNLIQGFAYQAVGSYLNSPFSGVPGGWTASEWRNILTKIQTTHMGVTGNPIIYGLDSVHGANYIQGAVLFPHQINVAASFNPALAQSLGQFAGRDTEAAGIPWIFEPCLEIARHKHWPRIYETYGEDPLVVSDMGAAFVQGVQSNNVAACFKHFIGYSGSPGGVDRDPVTLTQHELQNLFMPPFKAAIDAGAMTGMDTYISFNGVPMSANPSLSKDLLRTDLKFDGFLVSDWDEIYLMNSMVPYDSTFIGFMKSLYTAGQIPLDRIKTSAKRIIEAKLKLNLYRVPVPGAELVNQVGDAASQAAALNIARESLVLVKNANNVLPLDPTKKVFLTGASMDDIGLLCGGWTLSWQGQAGTGIFPNFGRTIRGAVTGVFNNPSQTSFYQGVNTDGTWQDINQAKALAQAADYTIVAIGERPYAEFMGNIDPVELPSGLTGYVQQLANTGTKIILILVEGRPRLLNGISSLASAILFAGLPCEMGGEAISDVLFGKINPSGKMAMTYPKTADQLNQATSYYGRVGDKCVVNGVPSTCPVEWHFGEGLSYTTFAYSNMQLSTTTLSPAANQLSVSVTVTNSGAVKGKEVVMLFLTSPNVPETKLLKKYSKIELDAGQSKAVNFTLTPDDFGVYVNDIGQGLKKAASNGTYFLVLKFDTICGASSIGPFCQSFTWNAAATADPANPPSPTPSTTLNSLTPTPATMTPPSTLAPQPSYYSTLKMVAFGLILTNPVDDHILFVQPNANDARQSWHVNTPTNAVVNKASLRCLDAWEPVNGGRVHPWPCDQTNVNQKWSYDNSTNQLRHIGHVGFCLDIGAPTDGTHFHVWQCLATTHPDYRNQQLVLAPSN
ncbi:Aste57867_19156 [Aphanomyces stellatus]|uniref:beta-glucosidase n=1 Tax=Aphanomyces stellatus TaxID=120398 RepID=A0A485LDD1_9STRA|nr:hypothetical protein As57867_019092 [Aphanomyces stellatus]VFT95878.1 Aste57867_19156 [Aphanomyces stellatus]